MFTFLLASSLALALLGFGFLAIPLLVVGGVIWLVLLPIKLLLGFVFGGLFRVVFGVLGTLLGLILAPLLLIVAGVAVVGAFIAALIALITPLVPVALLLLLGWGIYRVSARPRAVL